MGERNPFRCAGFPLYIRCLLFRNPKKRNGVGCKLLEATRSGFQAWLKSRVVRRNHVFPSARFASVLLLGLACAIWGYGLSRAQEPDSYAAARLKMVEDDIEREGISNKAVLQAMRSVPRHLFVIPEHRSKAYYDQALPIGHKQTITPPYLVAYMTALLDPKPADRVLEIGTGCGYQAAVLSMIVKEVYSIE